MIKTGMVPLKLAAQDEQIVILPDLTSLTGQGIYVRYLYEANCDTAWYKKGECLGFDQFQLVPQMERYEPGTASATPVFSQDDHRIYVSGDGFAYDIDRRTGLPCAMIFNNRQLLDRPMKYNLYRAPTDNDRPNCKDWERFHLQALTTRVYEIKASTREGVVFVTSCSALGWLSFDNTLLLSTQVAIYGSGDVRITMHAVVADKRPSLPRFGLRLFLTNAFEYVEYLGYGPNESYLDKRQSSYFGYFQASVTSLHEDYIRPQENGSHCGCEWVSLCDAKTKLTVYADQPFSFNSSHFTQEELALKKHNVELEPSGHTVLCLDYKQAGIGSNSCGPVLDKQYQLSEKQWDCSFTLSPSDADA